MKKRHNRELSKGRQQVGSLQKHPDEAPTAATKLPTVVEIETQHEHPIWSYSHKNDINPAFYKAQTSNVPYTSGYVNQYNTFEHDNGTKIHT